VPTDQLARLQLGAADGLILQYLITRDSERAQADLESFIRQLVRLAAPTPVAADPESPQQRD
jgi:hypothetical protein